jgi:hypothetical protein
MNVGSSPESVEATISYFYSGQGSEVASIADQILDPQKEEENATHTVHRPCSLLAIPDACIVLDWVGCYIRWRVHHATL